MLNISGLTSKQLCEYIAQQLNYHFPDPYAVKSADIEPYIEQSLFRIQTCINAVKYWKENHFDYLHSAQYCIFIYYLSNTIWNQSHNSQLCTKLFYLNKVMNGFDCFYDNNLPDRFFIGHTLGIVLVKNDYPDYLVLYQGVTVGRSYNDTPKIGKGVVFYPNASAIGRCNIGDGTVISQGCNVINRDTPSHHCVFNGPGGLTFKQPKKNILNDVFRHEG